MRSEEYWWSIRSGIPNSIEREELGIVLYVEEKRNATGDFERIL
jgi:hypothetical protein